jgi:spermidine/putrescine transport system permease protein
MPGVVAGTLLTFIPAAGDYVNAAILGSPNTKMIGNVDRVAVLQDRGLPNCSSTFLYFDGSYFNLGNCVYP